MASVLVSPAAMPLGRGSRGPRPGRWSWVMAIRWRATLSWRLPPRFRRWRVVVARPDRHRGGAVVAGEGRLRAEAADARRLADELGGGERAAAGRASRRRGERRPRGGRSRARGASMVGVSSRIRATRSRAMRATAPASPASAGLERRRGRGRGRAPRAAGSSPGVSSWRCQRRRFWARVRSATRSSRWSTRRRTSRSGPSSVRDRQVRLAQRRPGDRERVDRVALAGLARRAAGPGHELGRDPHDRLAGAQRSASRRRDRWRQSSSAQRRSGHRRGPATQLEVPRRGRPDGLLGELAARARRRPPRCASACADRPRSSPCPRLLPSRGDDAEDRSADTPESGRSHAPIKSRRPVRRVRRPAHRMQATPTGRAPSLGAKPSDATEGDTQAG